MIQDPVTPTVEDDSDVLQILEHGRVVDWAYAENHPLVDGNVFERFNKHGATMTEFPRLHARWQALHEICETIPPLERWGYLVTLRYHGRECRGYYKPNPIPRLIPEGMAGTQRGPTAPYRERAAYRISRLLGPGYDIIPPTAVRSGAGIPAAAIYPGSAPRRRFVGSVTKYIEDAVALTEAECQNTEDPQLLRLAILDFVLGNREHRFMGQWHSHTLRDPSGRIWGIDHSCILDDDWSSIIHPFVTQKNGIVGSAGYFLGVTIPPEILGELRAFWTDLVRREAASRAILDDVGELALRGFIARVEWLLEDGCFPSSSNEAMKRWLPLWMKIRRHSDA